MFNHTARIRTRKILPGNDPEIYFGNRSRRNVSVVFDVLSRGREDALVVRTISKEDDGTEGGEGSAGDVDTAVVGAG
jgi:hypothetical protein